MPCEESRMDEPFRMLQLEPRDPEFRAKFVAQVPQDGLPSLTCEEINEIEYARRRYDAIVGVIDPEEAGVDDDDAEADLTAHPDWVDTMEVVDEDQLAFMCACTGISAAKVATYLYYVNVEMMAAGLCMTETGEDASFEELAEDARDEYRMVMALVSH
jgi:hypothetical protein